MSLRIEKDDLQKLLKQYGFRRKRQQNGTLDYDHMLYVLAETVGHITIGKMIMSGYEKVRSEVQSD